MKPNTRTWIAASMALSLTFGGVAVAHVTTFRTGMSATLTEVGSTKFVKGKVKSPRSRCVPNRRVKVFLVDAGPDTLIASDTTNRSGGWQVGLGTSPQVGKYYGKVTRKDIGPGRHRHICKSAMSNQVTVVATDPTMTISFPDDGSTHPSGSNVPFIGSASDPQDGELSGTSIVWTSDLDGEIGTGESFSAPLSDGTHQITATATDSDGNVASDTISVTVTT